MSVAHRRSAARTAETAFKAVLFALGACASSADEGANPLTAPQNVGTFGADPMDAGAPSEQSEGSDGGQGTTPGAASGTGFRLLHAMPNVGPVVLCNFPGVQITDRDSAAAALGVSTGALVQGEDRAIAFGTLSPWFELDLSRGGVLSLHRAVTTVADAGVDLRDGGQAVQDGGALAGDAEVRDADDGGAQVRVCDPSTVEALLPIPLPDTWLTLTPENADAGTSGLVAGSAVDSAGAAVFGLGVGSRGIRATPADGTPTTLIASGLALNPAELAKRSASDATVENRFGPRLLFSAPPPVPASDAISLSLGHLAPDLAESQVARGLRACVSVDGEEGRPLPTMSVAPVSFRERVLLAGGLSATASYRVRIFSADDVGMPGQDCANTSRSPLAQLTIAPSDLEAGRAYTVLLRGLAAPERVCAAVGTGSLARPGCVAGDSRALRATLVAD
ncbi:MAG: hypothetical protein RL385_1217 [Pseudomonadota bacterium]|jgi:hypothetical protein